MYSFGDVNNYTTKYPYTSIRRTRQVPLRKRKRPVYDYRRPENDQVPLLPTTPSNAKYLYMTDKYHDDPNDYRRVYHYRRPETRNSPSTTTW